MHGYCVETPPQSQKLLTAREITEAARRLKYDMSKWTGHYNLDHLISSMDKEYIDVVETEHAITLHVQAAVVYVQHSIADARLELKELYQEWVSPPQRVKRGFRGISETIRRGHSKLDEAHRALAEEPGHSEVGFRDPANYQLMGLPDEDSNPEVSDKWPPFRAVYHRSRWWCFITNKQIYNPGGYYENQFHPTSGLLVKKTVFGWVSI